MIQENISLYAFLIPNMMNSTQKLLSIKINIPLFYSKNLKKTEEITLLKNGPERGFYHLLR